MCALLKVHSPLSRVSVHELSLHSILSAIEVQGVYPSKSEYVIIKCAYVRVCVCVHACVCVCVCVRVRVHVYKLTINKLILHNQTHLN